MKWLEALKIFNKGSPEWCVPKKGTKLYDKVVKIMNSDNNMSNPKPKKMSDNEFQSKLDDYKIKLSKMPYGEVQKKLSVYKQKAKNMSDAEFQKKIDDYKKTH